MKPDNGQIDLQRLRSTDAPELHRAIDAVKQQLPDPRQLAALAASLSQMGISVASSGHTTGATPPSATRLKLMLGAGVVGPLTVALLLWHSAAPRTTAPAASVSAAMPAPLALAPALASAPESSVRSKEVAKRSANPLASDASAPSPSSKASAIAAVGDKPVASSEPARSGPRVVAAATASAENVRSAVATAARSASPESIGPSVVARPTEVALLRDARLALNSNPTEALALSEQHRALYPRGAMVQERELIAISALARLGRHSAVLARAAQFERDFPTSPYRKQVNALAQ